MSVWVCWACRAHGEGEIDGDICPKCGKGSPHVALWLCCECWTEGAGQRPDECPACGCADSWFMTATDGDDPRPAKALYEELLDKLCSPSKRKH
jgi:hypothetical protein